MNPIILCTAGYTNNNSSHIGFTAVDGKIINDELEISRMDAFCLISNNRIFQVFNLQESVRINNRILDIRHVDLDKQFLIDYIEREKGSAFQTHLLVYRNQLKISLINSSEVTRERRLLGKVKEENGSISTVLLDFPASYTLAEVSKFALDFLNNFKEMYVLSLINLDTGAFDCLNIFNINGSLNNVIRGTVPIKSAPNFICVYVE